VLTLNQIVSQITNLATAHNQIAESGVGDFAEWQAKERSYPILWVFHESTAVSQMEIAFSIRLICADRVIVGEEGDDTQGHEQEVISDTLLVLLDFLAYFQQNHSQPYDVVTSATIDPFTERLNDRLAGNSVTIQIRQPFDWNKCQIPQTGASIPPTVDGLTLYNFCDPAVIARLTPEQVACLIAQYNEPCEDATVTINSAPFGTAPSGGSLNVPVIQNGNPVGSKVGSDWVIPPCADGTVNITNTDADPIASVTVGSGDTETYVIPNVDWTDSDGSAESTPYGDAIVCTLSPPSGDLTVTVSDATPSTGDTITITATATGFTPTNYLFFTYDGVTIEEIVEQASGVYAWMVDRIGTYDIYVVATDGVINVWNKVEVVAASGFVIDLITPQPVWAVSLRKLRSAYAGNAATVRRSSDNTTTNIGFIGEALDTAALTAFVGVGNGFTATLFNQMSTGSNATQSTAGNQPSMVVSGTVQLLGGEPTIVFNGTAAEMVVSPSITFAHGLVVARKSANTNVVQYVLGGVGQGLNMGGTLGGFEPILVFSSGGNLVSAVNNTLPHQISFKMGTGGTGRLRVDGVTQVTGTTSASMVISRVGTREDAVLRHVGDFSEAILYTSVLSDANELVIENNQRAYYGL
jgi:hypothetical protein